MRRILFAGIAAAIAAVAVSGSAEAAWRGGFWGPRVFIGPTFGFGVYAPYWVPPPVYYAPPPVVVQQGYAAPPAQQAPAAMAPPAASGNWYYCNNPQGYYPYVRQCNGQWQTVPANPDGDNR